MMSSGILCPPLLTRLDSHICRIERGQSSRYLIGIDELTTIKDVGQNSIGGGGFASPITAPDDV